MHFRYVRYEELTEERHESHKRPTEINWEFQRFANAFFQYLEKNALCPKLTALVVGMHWDILNHAPRDQDYYHVPRHCFIKGRQMDVLGRKTAIAVPVPSYLLRQAQPVSTILDLDPECEWIGGQPGRFHDV